MKNTKVTICPNYTRILSLGLHSQSVAVSAMRTMWRNVTEDRLTICTTRRSKPPLKTSEVGNSVEIPVDLIVEILSRLPAKSVAKSRCVSKLWGSLICRQNFTELFLTRSLHRPQLLFCCEKDGKLFFFSSPQLQNHVENSAAVSLMSLSFSSLISRPVHGLIALTYEVKEKVTVVCNPSTGHSLIFPTPPIWFGGLCSFLVYEPIRKQYKVLLSGRYEHRVLTVGPGVRSWRMIECSIPHICPLPEICINGVLYYPAVNLSSGDRIIVCFDVSSEKFRFITDTDNNMKDYITAAHDGTLINYNGKLASLVSVENNLVFSYSKSIELLILQDAEKLVWSKHKYVLPACWQDMVGTDDILRFVGVTRTNEIMLSPGFKTVPFYVFYFNIQKKTMMRVAIQGLEAFQGCIVLTYSDHVEDVKLMHMF